MTILLPHFIFFVAAAAFSVLLTPRVRKWAIQLKILDLPGGRRAHETPIATMGGIAIILSFFGTLFLSALLCYVYHSELLVENLKVIHLFLAALPLVWVGILDDKYRVRYQLKLGAQIVSVLLMVYFGHRIYAITNPLNSETVLLGFLSVPVTVLWFLFIINAVNIVDGVDGLAAGVALIALLTIFFVALTLNHKMEVAVLSAILAGSIAGFLRYNFHPASIFMGDTGSLFLGFILSVLSLHSSQKSSTAVALAIPIVILGLPILDVLLAVARRWSSAWVVSRTFRARFFSWRKIFRPDTDHIHHRLLSLGLTKPQTAALLYVVALLFGAAGFIMTAARYQYIAWALLYAGVVFFLAFGKFSALQRALPPLKGKQNGVLPSPPPPSDPSAEEGAAEEDRKLERVLRDLRG